MDEIIHDRIKRRTRRTLARRSPVALKAATASGSTAWAIVCHCVAVEPEADSLEPRNIFFVQRRESSRSVSSAGGKARLGRIQYLEQQLRPPNGAPPTPVAAQIQTLEVSQIEAAPRQFLGVHLLGPGGLSPPDTGDRGPPKAT